MAVHLLLAPCFLHGLPMRAGATDAATGLLLTVATQPGAGQTTIWPHAAKALKATRMGVRAEASAMLVVSGGYTEIPELGEASAQWSSSTRGHGPWDCQGLWAQASFPISPGEAPLVSVLPMEGPK